MGRRPLSSPLLCPRQGAGSQMVQARANGETMTTRATASAGNDGGRVRTLGRRPKPRPAGREPSGRGEPTPGGRPRFPGPLVARRYAPTGTGPAHKAAVDGRRPCSPRAVVDRHSRARRVSGWHVGAAARSDQMRRCRRSEAEFPDQSGGQGRGRTADLPLFRIKDHHAGLATEISLPAHRPARHADGRRCMWMHETRNETAQINLPAGHGT
jgi:hypothetical protein